MSSHAGPTGDGSSRFLPAADTAVLAFERIVGDVDATLDSRWNYAEDSEPVAGDPSVSHGQSPDVSSTARNADLLTGLLLRTAAGFADRTADVLRSLRPVTGTSVAPISLLGRPGTTVSAIVWLHNTSGGSAPGFSLLMTALTESNGAVLPGLTARFHPARFDPSMDRRRSSQLEVVVPADAVRGLYHGAVLANGLPEAAIAIRLVVE